MQNDLCKIKCAYQSSTIYENQKRVLNYEFFFFSLQFNYCPLTWMFRNRLLNHKINILDERCLCVIYNNCHLSYDELVNLDNPVSMHQQNLQILATEISQLLIF